MRVDHTTEAFVREPDGRVRVWANDGTEQHVPGQRFFSPSQVRVALDDVVLDGFIAADDVEGWVERYRLDAAGRPIVTRWPDDPGGDGAHIRCSKVELATERLTGRVEFVWPEARS